MARGDSINSLLQMQAYRRAEMEGTIARRDVFAETKAYVEQWRKNNGLEGTKALPNRNEVPFQWMIPFLDKVETEDTKPSPIANQGMMIATDPSMISQPTEKGYFLDAEEGIYGHVYQNEGGYLKEGKMYDQGIHGLPVPLI